MRSTRIAAIGGGALVGLVVAVLFVLRPLPDRVISLLGGPTGIDRVGGIRIEYVFATGKATMLEYPEVAQDMIPALRDVLVGGGLRMQEVIESDFASSLEPYLEGEVRVELDQWRPEQGGSTHTDSYLIGPSREELDRVLSAAPVKAPARSEIRFEKIVPYPGDEEQRVLWRSYLLATEVLVDGTDIANAVASYDPNTNRPLVLLDFTEGAADKFCTVTARIVGKKLATILGDEVRSAPIINGQICGGRASITMGGSDPMQQEQEAKMLVGVLGQGAFPPGGTITSATWIAPAELASREWIGRLLLGLIAALVTAVILLASLRFIRPSPRTPPASVAGAFPTRRLIVTLCAPVALLIASRLVLPAVNEVELMHITRSADTALFSVVALGLSPIFSAFVLVELVALAVPRLRWRRHDPRGRVRLSQATAIVSVLLALAQGYFVAVYLERGSMAGAEIVTTHGVRFQLLTMVTLATGTLVLALIAGAITAHGLGNGYGVLFVSTWLLELFSGLIAENVPFPWLESAGYFEADWLNRERLFGLLGAAVMAAISWCLLRWRMRGDDERECDIRMPSSTATPLTDAGGIVLVIATLSALGVGDELASVHWRITELVARTPIHLALVVGSVPFWAWLLARRSLIERVALQANVVRPSQRTWLRAMFLSALALGMLAALGRVVALAGAGPAHIADAFMVLIATAVALDIVDDARANRERLVCVGALHQIQRANVIERLLLASNIRCHIGSGNLRALFNFFGPWAPALVLVPEADAATARDLVDGITAEARTSIPRATVANPAPPQ